MRYGVLAPMDTKAKRPSDGPLGRVSHHQMLLLDNCSNIERPLSRPMSNQASTPPLQLPDGAVDVWIVDLRASDQALRAANSLLNHEELTRARRFRFPNDRRRFVMARATARQVLGRYLQQTPESLQFEYGDHGKPRLASPSVDLRFNTSRSAERALIACTLRPRNRSR